MCGGEENKPLLKMGDYNISNPNSPYDLKKPEDVKEYLENIDKEFKFQCYHNKEADGCHRLGDLMEIVEKDYSRALTVYKHSCEEYNYGHSCFKCGQYRMLGRGGESQDFNKALELFEKGCTSSEPHAVACHNAGLLLIDEKRTGLQPDYTKSHNYLLKACDLRDGKACFSVSSTYLKGSRGVTRDPQKGLDCAVKACNLMHAGGCVNASRIYQNGDGVERDLDMAQQYFKKAQHIQNPTDELKFSRPA